MPNIGAVLREEIQRLARREIRGQTGALRKASAQHRRDIARMKRQVSDLQRKLAVVVKQAGKGAASPETGSDAKGVRFTAKGLRSQRQRLGLSAANYGKLVGVTGQTIYSWEQETARPRRQQVEKIAALRGIGKRQALALLDQQSHGGRRKAG